MPRNYTYVLEAITAASLSPAVFFTTTTINEHRGATLSNSPIYSHFAIAPSCCVIPSQKYAALSELVNRFIQYMHSTLPSYYHNRSYVRNSRVELLPQNTRDVISDRYE